MDNRKITPRLDTADAAAAGSIMASIPSTMNSAEAAIYQPAIFLVAGDGPCKS